jgi:hypothetical protein
LRDQIQLDLIIKKILKTNSAYILEFLIYILVGISSWYLFRNQAFCICTSDLRIHLNIIDAHFNDGFMIPHPGFHFLVYYLSQATNLPYTSTAPVLMSSVLIVTFFIINRLFIGLINKPKYNMFIICVATSLSFVTAIYLPFFNRYLYLGQFSPNIWHNPTMLVLKPFAIISFFYSVKYFFGNETLKIRNAIFLSFMILLSTVMKPSFVIVFLPALGLYIVIFKTKKWHLYLDSFLVVLPTVMLLLYQYIKTFQMDLGDSYFYDKIIFTNFGFLKLYSPNVFISALLVLAFPLSVVILNFESLKNNESLRLAWILTVIAYLVGAFLAEQNKFDQGAFCFSYVISLFILYMTSLLEMFNWINQENKFKPVMRIYACSAIYSLHLISGIFYYVRYLSCGDYF